MLTLYCIVVAVVVVVDLTGIFELKLISVDEGECVCVHASVNCIDANADGISGFNKSPTQSLHSVFSRSTASIPSSLALAGPGPYIISGLL